MAHFCSHGPEMPYGISGYQSLPGHIHKLFGVCSLLGLIHLSEFCKIIFKKMGFKRASSLNFIRLRLWHMGTLNIDLGLPRRAVEKKFA